MGTRAMIEGRKNRGIKACEAVVPVVVPAVKVAEKQESAGYMRVLPPGVAVIPNAFTKCAIFGFSRYVPIGERVQKTGQRPGGRLEKRFRLNGARMASMSHVEVSFSGYELHHDDVPTYVAILKLCQGKRFSERIYYNERQFVREVQQSTTGADYEIVRDRIEYLSNALINISIKQKAGILRVTCGLIKSGIDTKAGIGYFDIDKAGAGLFRSLAYIDWQMYQQITSQKGRAIYLYAVGQENGKAQSVSAKELRCLLGYPGRLHDFLFGKSAPLLACLQELEALGFLEKGSSAITKSPTGGNVAWTRTPVTSVDGMTQISAIEVAAEENIPWTDYICE